MAPLAFTSKRKLEPVVVWPDRDLTPLMSLELTDWLLLTSPTRNPSVAATLTPAPLTLPREIVARWLSGILISVTTTSKPEIAAETVPTGVTAAVPVAVIGR